MHRHDQPVPWADIERAYRAGESTEAIAKALPRKHGTDSPLVSRQAIDKRARRDGWIPGVSAAVGAQAHAVAATSPQPKSATIRNHGNLAALLELIHNGMSFSGAVKTVGLADTTVREWLRSDPEVQRAFDEARANGVRTRLGRVMEAGARGDVRADQWLLERSPHTRDDFGQPRDGRGGPGVQITLNVPGPWDQQGNRPAIDVTPKPLISPNDSSDL